jgi:hypothetical protein
MLESSDEEEFEIIQGQPVSAAEEDAKKMMDDLMSYEKNHYPEELAKKFTGDASKLGPLKPQPGQEEKR